MRFPREAEKSIDELLDVDEDDLGVETLRKGKAAIKETGIISSKNVLLTKEEYMALKEKFPKSHGRYINDLSYYIKSKGAKYKSHYAVILKWNKDKNEDESSFDTDDFFEAAVRRSNEKINRAMEKKKSSSS